MIQESSNNPFNLFMIKDFRLFHQKFTAYTVHSLYFRIFLTVLNNFFKEKNLEGMAYDFCACFSRIFVISLFSTKILCDV